MGSAIARETAIGIAVTALALVAMVFDHLLGDDPGLEDPIAFIGRRRLRRPPVLQ